MAFVLGRPLIFLDSFQFMSSSLDALANNLPDEAFKYTSEVFKDKKFKLMKHMITWAALISLMKNYQEKLNFTVFFKMSTYLMSNTNMHKCVKCVADIQSQDNRSVS